MWMGHPWFALLFPRWNVCIVETHNKVSYNLDHGAVIGKSDVNRGYWALAQLLTQVKVVQNTPAAQASDTALLAEESQTMTHSASRVGMPHRPFEMHDVYAAIERKDVEKIMLIRDSAFELLLGVEEGVSWSGKSHTPLDYAISLGPAYNRVCLFLVGAMSRYVNHLPDDEPPSPAQIEILRRVRANLKLGIDHSLFKEETSLVSSYLQVLVMSEGMEWLRHTVHNVEYELEAWAGHELPPDGVIPDPLRVAQDAIASFLTLHLRLRRETERVVVASVDDYVANATGDLILLALWSKIPHEEDLPLHAFARDDRCTELFCEMVVGTSLPKQPAGRTAKLWRTAQHIVDRLDEGMHRRNAKERLSLLSSILK